MIWGNISNIENDLLTELTQSKFDIFVSGSIFIQGAYICKTLVTNYNSWYYPIYSGNLFGSVALTDLWVQYVREWQHSINRIYEALQVSYAPLENYKMEEHESIGRKLDKTITNPNGTTSSNYKSTTYDDVSLRNVDETVNTTNITTTITPSNTQSIPDIQGSYNNGDVRKMTRSGNIGVTTSQQMINSEIEVRKQSIADWLIFSFVKKYMMMVEDGEIYE